MQVGRKFVQALFAEIVLAYMCFKTGDIEWGLLLLSSAGLYGYLNIKQKKEANPNEGITKKD